MKFGGKIHNCKTKNEFDFGIDRVKVKVKRGQKVLLRHAFTLDPSLRILGTRLQQVNVEWRGKCFFSLGNNHSIIIDRKFGTRVNRTELQNDGRKLFVNCSHRGL